MPLSHNQPFRLLDDAYGLVRGLYRMVIADPQFDLAICVLIRPEDPTHRRPGGRPAGANTKRPNQTPKKPQVGALSKISYALLQELFDEHEIVPQSLELPSLYYTPQSSEKSQQLFDQRCRVMAEFLDFSRLRESLIVRGNLSG